MDRHLFFENSALLALHRVWLGMLLDAIYALDEQHLTIKSLDDRSALSLIATRNDYNVVTFSNFLHI
jgi:hypothetical protein